MKVTYLRYKSCTTNNLPLCCELFVTGAVKEKGKSFVVSWKIISRKLFVILPDLLVLGARRMDNNGHHVHFPFLKNKNIGKCVICVNIQSLKYSWSVRPTFLTARYSSTCVTSHFFPRCRWSLCY